MGFPTLLQRIGISRNSGIRAKNIRGDERRSAWLTTFTAGHCATVRLRAHNPHFTYFCLFPGQWWVYTTPILFTPHFCRALISLRTHRSIFHLLSDTELQKYFNTYEASKQKSMEVKAKHDKGTRKSEKAERIWEIRYDRDLSGEVMKK